ncbi:MAG: DUF2795 domain-containing protein [Desulfuromonadales bacterium]|nr:DUF2795 domain-containing protein [Desulfuromonadales bacterium]
MARGVGGHSPSNVAQYLKGINFPAHLPEMIKQAQKNNADKEVIEELKQMPDEEYGSMSDVMKGYGKKH